MAMLTYRLVSILIGVGLIIGFNGSLGAQAPPISIALNLDKETYEYGEPIPVAVVVTNQSSSGILINQGFSSTVFYLEMRVIDPAQKLVVATREEFHDEFPDAPPLAWILHDNKPVRVAGCESLPPGSLPESYTADLRDHYDILLPGYYSAQVQVSAMVFEGAPCEADAFKWQGVLSSETRFFYVQGSSDVPLTVGSAEGSAEVKIKPDKWELKWTDPDKKPKEIKVEIKPEGDLTVDDFEVENIKLNNLAALEVKKKKSKIEAYFDGRQAMENLGNVECKHWDRALVSGFLRNGDPFGTELEIQIKHIGGNARVKVKPDKWELKWTDPDKKPKKIKVEIKPEGDLTVEDFVLESIELNNLAAMEVKKKKSKIEAYFECKQAIEILGDVEAKQSYRVLISGELKSGDPFCSEEKIKIKK
jgi:hypothetical protein